MIEEDSTKEERIADMPPVPKHGGLPGMWRRLRSEPESGPHSKDHKNGTAKLGDYTTTTRTIIISLFAIVVGAIGAVVALILLSLIGLFTNLFFFQRWSTALSSPAGNHLGVLEIAVPVIGALIVGLMARFGSEKIRGHGIPEALEAILINGSKIEPKVAILKPISSAISIGSGGPFGAEGPIIMTGGAFGSLIAQFFHFTSAERKTLLVAGAAAGMSATFSAPVASVLLAVELMLFEWKPRSLIPVALASATAGAVRFFLLGTGPIFPTPPHPSFIGVGAMFSCLFVGILVGILGLLLTYAVYAAEDGFRRLPIHWMWWPAIGGLVIGIGGLIFPQALGVGYDVIGKILSGSVTTDIILGVLIVKSIIWSVSLGSGTSGGVLAPLLMIGGALGGILGTFLPYEGVAFWSLICMGAILGSTLRAPLTGVIFTLELTHDVNALLPLLITTFVAFGFTVLVMRRDILTEKVSRRGYHLTREYATDPLEILFVREVMRTNIVALSAKITPADLARSLRRDPNSQIQLQRLYPVLDDEKRLIGVVARNDLRALAEKAKKGEHNGHDKPASSYELAALVNTHPIVAYPDEPLRGVIYRMADTGFTRFPVVESVYSPKLIGMVSLNDLLTAMNRNIAEERKRERILRIRTLLPSRSRAETL